MIRSFGCRDTQRGIFAGKRAISADTDLRLCKFFGLSDSWWLRLRASYDTAKAKRKLGKELEKIVPLARLARLGRLSPLSPLSVLC